MQKLECPVCGFRITVEEADAKFGMSCPACEHRRLGPPRTGPPPAPLGGLGRLPMEVVRPLAGAPMCALAAVLMYRWGWHWITLIIVALLAGGAIYLLLTGLVALARHRSGTDPRQRHRYRK